MFYVLGLLALFPIIKVLKINEMLVAKDPVGIPVPAVGRTSEGESRFRSPTEYRERDLACNRPDQTPNFLTLNCLRGKVATVCNPLQILSFLTYFRCRLD